MNEFKAALETEYAGSLGAGKIARLELVLHASVYCANLITSQVQHLLD